jgi:outer membrane protein
MKFLLKPTLALAALLFLALSAHSQETWSLERCIRYAQENNITVQQAQANVKLSQLSQQQAKAQRLPNVSASISAGEQFGRTIDPTTNQFSQLGVGFNRLGLDAGVNVFNGGLVNHSIKQAGWDVQAARASAEQTSNNLALQVASAYLNVLLSGEQLDNATRRVSQDQSQLAVTQKLIEAGTVPVADRFTVLSQLARDEQAAVQARNSLEIGYLSLKQLLQLEPDFLLEIERPEAPIPADADPGAVSLTPLYAIATETQPSVRATQFQVKSAEEGIAIAQAAYYPTLSVFANLSSNYSTQLRDQTKEGTLVRQETFTSSILVNDQPVTITQFFDVFEYPRTAYFKQIDQNFGQGLGVSLNIPIYQNGRTRLNVERARLNVLTAQMQNTQAQQTLKNDIQTAIANARAARQQLDAAQKTFDAMQLAFQNTEKRHALGAVNSLDLTTAQNNLSIAENDLVVAKYDYLFKLKILDFYQGKPLTMN